MGVAGWGEAGWFRVRQGKSRPQEPRCVGRCVQTGGRLGPSPELPAALGRRREPLSRSDLNPNDMFDSPLSDADWRVVRPGLAGGKKAPVGRAHTAAAPAKRQSEFKNSPIRAMAADDYSKEGPTEQVEVLRVVGEVGRSSPKNSPTS